VVALPRRTVASPPVPMSSMATTRIGITIRRRRRRRMAARFSAREGVVAVSVVMETHRDTTVLSSGGGARIRGSLWETLPMFDVHVVFLGAIIGLSGTAMYARDTFRGVTQPNRVTWFLWFLAPMLAFSVEIHQGVGLRSTMTLVIGLGPLLVLIASFANRQSTWKLGPFDVACGIASFGGLVLWLVTSDDMVALFSFMTADFLAGLPTIVKSWREPSSESTSAYLTGFINALLTLSTVTVWTTAEVAFPIQIVAFNLLEVALIAGRLGPRTRHEPTITMAPPVEHVIAGFRNEAESTDA